MGRGRRAGYVVALTGRDGRGGELLGAALVPGLGLHRRHRIAAAALLLIGTVAPVAWLVVAVVRHGGWVALGLDRRFLTELIGVLAVACVSRVVAVFEVLQTHRAAPYHRGRTALAGLALAAVTIPCVVGGTTAAQARSDIGRVFEDGPDGPLFDAAADTTVPSVTTPPTTISDATPPSSSPTSTSPPIHSIPREVIPGSNRVAPDSGVDPEMLADITTVLLLGGDAGPGRQGLRTDTMILVSIHRPSGRAALISVPRDLEHLLFPPGSPMYRRYSNGFTEIANAVYPIVSSDAELGEAYSAGGLRPGAAAIAQGIGYSLDLTIDDYVLIDMAGFVRVIDALGGVTVDVPKRVPTPGNPPDAAHEVPEYIEAGTQHMDGTTALAYVRSRKSDSDYQRANRQRSVLAALARQVSLGDAITSYGAVTSALGDSLRTSLDSDEFVYLMGLLGGETAIVESMGLVPPLVDVKQPDYDAMAKIVGEIQVALVTDVPSGY